jgi:hypothetical protein
MPELPGLPFNSFTHEQRFLLTSVTHTWVKQNTAFNSVTHQELKPKRFLRTSVQDNNAFLPGVSTQRFLRTSVQDNNAFLPGVSTQRFLRLRFRTTTAFLPGVSTQCFLRTSVQAQQCLPGVSTQRFLRTSVKDNNAFLLGLGKVR